MLKSIISELDSTRMQMEKQHGQVMDKLNEVTEVQEQQRIEAREMHEELMSMLRATTASADSDAALKKWKQGMYI